MVSKKGRKQRSHREGKHEPLGRQQEIWNSRGKKRTKLVVARKHVGWEKKHNKSTPEMVRAPPYAINHLI